MEILDKIIYRYLAKKDYPEIAVLVNDCVELNVLKGMEKNIIKNLPIIAFEGKIDSTKGITKYLSKIGYDTFLVPSDYKINNYIKTNNYLLLALRFLIRKLSFKFKYRLDKISDVNKDYNLILAVSQNSKFYLK